MKQLKPGDRVKMVDCFEARRNKDTVWMVKSEPWELGCTMVVSLDGYSGGFDCDCLRKVKD